MKSPLTVSREANESIFEALARLNKTIRQCEQSIAIANRLQAQRRWKAQYDGELATVETNLVTARKERERLESAICRYSGKH